MKRKWRKGCWFTVLIIVVWWVWRSSTSRIKRILGPTAMPVLKNFARVWSVHCSSWVYTFKLALSFTCKKKEYVTILSSKITTYDSGSWNLAFREKKRMIWSSKLNYSPFSIFKLSKNKKATKHLPSFQSTSNEREKQLVIVWGEFKKVISGK